MVFGDVSTHSRLKAAASNIEPRRQADSFNTQPPEGGCSNINGLLIDHHVSTHSRLKAAGKARFALAAAHLVSTHSRLKAAADFFTAVVWENRFNTQPPEGGCIQTVSPV